MTIDEIVKAASVIPVLEIPSLEITAPLAEALAKGGLCVVEIALRTDCALNAVKAMCDVAPDLIVGMGTIRTDEDVKASIEAGAAFLVSPGASPALLDAFRRHGAPAVPGVATATEAMTAFEAGFSVQKFFPAELAGGIAFLQAIAGPLPDITFFPTGGISAKRVPDYLALPNVACVGGSWIATRKMISAGDWDAITANAKRAASLKKLS